MNANPQLVTRLSSIRMRRDMIEGTNNKLATRINVIALEKESLLKAIALIDKTNEVISANGIGKIESVVTGGMRRVFNDPTIGFRIEKKETAGGTNYMLMPYHGEISGPAMDTFGGGWANVIAFLLRLIMIKRFRLAKLIVIDESFNNVSDQYLPAVSELLQAMAAKGFDILAITHQPLLAKAADHMYRAVAVPNAPPLLEKLDPSEL